MPRPPPAVPFSDIFARLGFLMKAAATLINYVRRHCSPSAAKIIIIIAKREREKEYPSSARGMQIVDAKIRKIWFG